jgi:hypothetical protein
VTARAAELAGQVARLQESMTTLSGAAVRLVVGEGRFALAEERPGWQRPAGRRG